MGDDNGSQGNDDFKYLASYLTQFGKTATRLCFDRQVYWNQPLINNHDLDLPNLVIHEKIKSAFCKVTSSPSDSIIQFWAPSSGTRVVLSTENQPFALSHLNTHLRKYRLSCLKHLYDVKEEGSPTVIAYLNHLPEVVLDLKATKCPLLHIALKHDLTCSVMLPVFDTSFCIGVVECCMMHSSRLLSVFSELKYSLQSVGLSIFDNVYDRPQSSCLTTDATQQALRAICSSHDLPLAQVWILNHRSSSDKPLLLKSAYYYGDDPHFLPAYKFYNHSHILPLSFIQGRLVDMTLQTGQPHFCKDISKLRPANGLLGLLSATTNCSSFVMSLKNKYNVEYVFEFLWPQSRNNIILLESMLLLTLNRYLPSFKLPSLDDELCVIDVDTSAKIAIGPFSNLQGMKPESHLESEDYEEDDADDKDLILVARYQGYVTLLLLSDSSTFTNTKEKIVEDLGLDPAGTYSYEITQDHGMSFFTVTDDEIFVTFVSYLRCTPALTHLEMHVRSI